MILENLQQAEEELRLQNQELQSSNQEFLAIQEQADALAALANEFEFGKILQVLQELR